MEQSFSSRGELLVHIAKTDIAKNPDINSKNDSNRVDNLQNRQHLPIIPNEGNDQDINNADASKPSMNNIGIHSDQIGSLQNNGQLLISSEGNSLDSDDAHIDEITNNIFQDSSDDDYVPNSEDNNSSDDDCCSRTNQSEDQFRQSPDFLMIQNPMSV
ncbi:hypothetical protein LSTR_LSTR008817 [Laodelphax striatellus]|uniref:Uncharacterized protein n=1 Tax=Laodelphax striatellus TaxID=195883 RepID=A0A482X3K8_LAOST|nr:hypothetical protein LSTR_LSTR008817 [Laodelphax striatellus]